MTLYDIPAPAKINLFLHVVGRRDDGYHLLQTLFRFVDLRDTLHIETRADGRIARSTELPGVPPDQDLVVRAARALQAATGTALGAQIAVDKRIPAGGGLGGGSSDAASTLIALNRLWKTGLTRQALMRLALPLGADVPVFVFGQSAFAQGVGEQLAAVALRPRAYLIVQPQAAVPTAGVFAAPELTRDTKLVKIADFSDLLETKAVDKARKPGAPGDGCAGPAGTLPAFFGRNDLEPVVFGRYPPVRQAARWLADQGVAVRMSGSGACLFGEFAGLPEALFAQSEIAAKMRLAQSKSQTQGSCPIAQVFACDGLDEHPLRHWIDK
ncbi:4-(cytidine 5'-diphospho)-2-C-methyl-D-erythritol kinase [Orrella sp. JC864]|uniref:4-(cytidine 5'-diphospho)-2-C-methyl-D-erythritol kinase n=1 Tax=Orrella sp. JC864 TaxID=3120298 RepID=UPI00300BB0B8